MIDFRYHIVSLVAVFLALATGILLGAGPLSEPIQGQVENQTEALRADQQELRAANSRLQERIELGNAYTAESRQSLVGDTAAGRRVVLLTLPGVEDSLREDTKESLEQAGAVVSGTIQIQESFLEGDRAADVAELLEDLGSNESADPGSPQARTGEALARALVTSVRLEEIGSQVSATETGSEESPAAAGGDAAAAVLDALAGLGLIDVDGEPAARANLAVVLAPGGGGSGDVADASSPDASERDAALLPLVAALDAQGRGAVVAGAALSAGDEAFVRAVRAEEELAGVVTTIDVADTPQGQVALLLALAEQARGGAGAYGLASGADSVLPPVLTAPTDGDES